MLNQDFGPYTKYNELATITPGLLEKESDIGSDMPSISRICDNRFPFMDCGISDFISLNFQHFEVNVQGS